MKLQNCFCKKLISHLIKGKCLCLFGQRSLPTVNGDDVEYQDMYTDTIPVDRNEKLAASQQSNLVPCLLFMREHFECTNKNYIMKSLTKPVNKKWILLVCIFIFILSSCRKEIISNEQQQELASVANNGKNENKIYVSNLDQLYAAVNNPANTGSVVVLAPGTYVLNASYPNAGRLELLENMKLQGQPGHPEEVIIDASQLPGSSFVPPLNFPAPRTGAIRMGRGSNAIEWLTVKGNSSTQALSVIDTDLIWPGVSYVRVAHSIVTGGRIGIDIRNVNAASNGRIIEAEIIDNEIVDNLVQFGQGIEVQNANGASHAIIRAILNGNYVHGNKIGLRTFNNNANNSNTDFGNISIQSNADRFEDNGIGIYFSAGLNQGSTTSANGNLLRFEAHGTSIQNNTGTLPPENTPPCGIYAVAGQNTSGGTTSDNRLEINFWGCPISGNRGADIIAFGAYSPTPLPAGTNNVAEIYLHGVSSNAIDIVTPSVPAEPAGTNKVNLFR